jgi:hypothetical protein
MEVALVTFVMDYGRQPVVSDGKKQIQERITSGRLCRLFQYLFHWVNALNMLLNIWVVGTQHSVVNILIGQIKLSGWMYIGFG